MGACPICNGFREMELRCESCHSMLIDFGRVMDYGGKYDAYEEIDLLKQNNEIANDLEEGLCPHYLICPTCNGHFLYAVEEK